MKTFAHSVSPIVMTQVLQFVFFLNSRTICSYKLGLAIPGNSTAQSRLVFCAYRLCKRVRIRINRRDVMTVFITDMLLLLLVVMVMVVMMMVMMQ